MLSLLVSKVLRLIYALWVAYTKLLSGGITWCTMYISMLLVQWVLTLNEVLGSPYVSNAVGVNELG